MKSKNNALRNIARHELWQLFGNLAPETLDELETALVRQWITYDGHAGLITPGRNFWFKLERQGDGYHVGTNPCDSRVAAMLRECGADEEEFPELFHRANLSQSAPFVARGVEPRRLVIDPRERRVTVEAAAERDGE